MLHVARTHLLCLSLCSFCSFLPLFVLSLGVFCSFYPRYCFTSFPSFITCTSIISLASAVPLVPARSPVTPWLTLSSLSPFYLSCCGKTLRYSRAVVWLEVVSPPANIFPCAPLCHFVHWCMKSNVTSETVTLLMYPFPLPSSFFPLYPSYFACT